MEMGGYGYEKPELLTIAEQIYDCKSRKQDLELELDSEKFHQKYIPRRRELMIEQVLSHLPLVIILTILVISSFIALAMAVADPEEYASGNAGLVACALCLVFGGYADLKFIIQIAHMLTLLRISVNSEKAMRYAKKHDINTFQSDAAISKEKIKILEQKIAVLEDELAKLTKHQQEITEKKQKQEEVLRKNGILFDEKPQKTEDALTDNKKSGAFTLKEESVGTQDALQLHEFYCHEEQYIYNCILQLEGRIQRTDKEIIEIDDNFELVKKQIMISVVIYLLMAFVQAAFTGIVSDITAMLCIIISIVYVIYFERRCKRPILLYLVEHDSKLTQEYAFCNSMMPVRNKRNELLEMIENYQKELEDIKKKKAEIVF